MIFEWKDDYLLGDAVIDAQHQRLFDLANQLMVVDDVFECRRLAMALYKHTRLHFEYEEAEMRRCHFPELVSHVELHHKMLEQLNSLSQDIGKGKLDKDALSALMTDWVMFHILHFDSRFASYIQPPDPLDHP